MKLAYAATMIRPRLLTNSIVAQVVSMPTFLHSLDPKQNCALLHKNGSAPSKRWRGRPETASQSRQDVGRPSVRGSGNRATTCAGKAERDPELTAVLKVENRDVRDALTAGIPEIMGATADGPRSVALDP